MLLPMRACLSMIAWAIRQPAPMLCAGSPAFLLVPVGFVIILARS